MLLQDCEAHIFPIDGEGGHIRRSFTFGVVSIEVPPSAFESNGEISLASVKGKHSMPSGLYDHPCFASSPFQIDVSPAPLLPLTVTIALPSLHGIEHVRIVKADSVNNVWLPHSEYSCLFYMISFDIDSGGTYGIVYNDFPLSDTARRNSTRWPTWSRVRREDGTITQRFENAMALETDSFRQQAAKLTETLFLDACPTDVLDIVYRADLPQSICAGYELTFVSDKGDYIPEVPHPDNLAHALELSLVYVNYATQTAYFSKPHEFVSVGGRFAGVGSIEILPRHRILPELHCVWNRLDEYGLLLGLPRLKNERNPEYKQRLLSSGYYPADATHQGLIHGLAKRLGLIKTVYWLDLAEPLEIVDEVLPNSIRLNGRRIKDDLITLDNSLCTIQPQTKERGISGAVTYVRDVIHLYNLASSDEVISKLKWNSAGGPTLEHKELAERINKKAPILWGYLKCDEAWWDPIDLTVSDLACLPPTSDAPISYYAKLNAGF